MLSKSSLNKGGSYLTEPERELGSQIKMVKKKGMTTTTVWQGPLQPWITEMGSFSGGRHQVLGTPASHFTHKPEAGNAAHKFPPSFFFLPIAAATFLQMGIQKATDTRGGSAL